MSVEVKGFLSVISKHQGEGRRRCPACDRAAGRAAGHKNGFELLSCRKCRTLYVAALPVAANAQDYDGYYSAESLSVPDFIHRRLDEIVAEFSAYRQTTRLLDVGFGAGSLLQAAARANWDVEGQEISLAAIERARQLGFKAFHGELAAARYPTGHFDVITASEVLEHLPHPRPLVSEIARILRPGGLFWATTPHALGLSDRLLGLRWSVICPPEHLHLFTLRGMKMMLGDAGFSNVSVASEGLNPYEIMQTLRRRRHDPAGAAEAVEVTATERVEAGYQLNETLSQSPLRRALKNGCNGLLRASRLGDSVKIFARH